MLMTAKDYMESLRQLKLNPHLFGKRVENWVDNPIIRPSINAIAMTYELAHDSEWIVYSPEKRRQTYARILREMSHQEGNEGC